MRATKTLAAIEAALVADQGAKYRGLLKKYMKAATDPFRTDEPPFRSHLGASILGDKCSRKIWYNFHWAKKIEHDGKLLRLFNRGHLEEPRFLALLEMISCEVWAIDEKGRQWRAGEGHCTGSLDAVIKGIPDCPETPLLAEFKTHSDKSFTKLEDEGVIKAKWQHFCQMQFYMGKMNLKGALYLAVNKNDDSLYGELIAFDQRVYHELLMKANSIVASIEPPKRYSENSANSVCKFCDYRDVCFSERPPAVNCRTCDNVIITSERFSCRLKDREEVGLLSYEEQLLGCSQYERGF